MRIESFAWTTFRIPLVADFTTAHGPLRVREGALIRITAGGIEAYGEASTVPGFPGPGPDQIVVPLEQLGRAILGKQSHEAAPYLAQARGSPAARVAAVCAVDVALHDLQARERGVSVAALLGGDPARAIPVNATVGNADLQEAARAAEAAVAAGFGCVKLKVGVAKSLEEEVRRVRTIRDAIGRSTRLRLDANGAWDRSTAVGRILALEEQDLELVEQPVPADDVPGMAEVRAAVRTPIAADEAVGSADQARRIILAEAADVLIIKPLGVGGLSAAAELIRLARGARLGAIVTTSIDSGVGIAAAVHLCAMLPDQQWACGLGTGPLLVSDLGAEPIRVVAGVMRIPAQPGLGFSPDPEQLARYADGWHGIAA
ncbi:MAG: mandelate racemase/muconate lactonizing enzyme family protein [Chloroflexi bacterium]|nr:mandelate racemase/muconate lactonizing enzyme family protein [Chloroflexota bacterium]